MQPSKAGQNPGFTRALRLNHWHIWYPLKSLQLIYQIQMATEHLKFIKIPFIWLQGTERNQGNQAAMLIKSLINSPEMPTQNSSINITEAQARHPSR